MALSSSNSLSKFSSSGTAITPAAPATSAEDSQTAFTALLWMPPAMFGPRILNSSNSLSKFSSSGTPGFLPTRLTSGPYTGGGLWIFPISASQILMAPATFGRQTTRVTLLQRVLFQRHSSLQRISGGYTGGGLNTPFRSLSTAPAMSGWQMAMTSRNPTAASATLPPAARPFLPLKLATPAAACIYSPVHIA